MEIIIMGYREHKGRRPAVIVPNTGQFPNSTCVKTNQSNEGISLDIVLSSQKEFVDNVEIKNHWAAAIITNCILTSK